MKDNKGVTDQMSEVKRVERTCRSGSPNRVVHAVVRCKLTYVYSGLETHE